MLSITLLGGGIHTPGCPSWYKARHTPRYAYLVYPADVVIPMWSAELPVPKGWYPPRGSAPRSRSEMPESPECFRVELFDVHLGLLGGRFGQETRYVGKEVRPYLLLGSCHIKVTRFWLCLELRIHIIIYHYNHHNHQYHKTIRPPQEHHPKQTTTTSF